jgi:hypothetical protein
MKIATRCILVGLAVFAAGCMQVEYGIVLEEDLSGTADMDLTVDLDRIAQTSAAVKAAFEGTGAPTEEQIEEARKEMLAEIDTDGDLDTDELRSEIEPDLPEGMTLVSVEQERDGLKRRVRLNFAFDHVDRLKEFSTHNEGYGGPGSDHDRLRPFEGLEITEKGDEIEIRNEPIDPLDEIEGNAFVSGKMIENMLQDVSVTFRLESPFVVLDHNATRREGRTLVWVFDLERLRREQPGGIYARLRR